MAAKLASAWINNPFGNAFQRYCTPKETTIFARELPWFEKKNIYNWFSLIIIYSKKYITTAKKKSGRTDTQTEERTYFMISGTIHTYVPYVALPAYKYSYFLYFYSTVCVSMIPPQDRGQWRTLMPRTLIKIHCGQSKWHILLLC